MTVTDRPEDSYRRHCETMGAQEERGRIVAWLWSEDARRYTGLDRAIKDGVQSVQILDLVAKAIEEGRHMSGRTGR